MKKIGRRTVRPLAISRVLSRELLMDADTPALVPLLRRTTIERLRPGLVSDRWVSWRPIGPIVEATYDGGDLFMRNQIEYSARQPWESRFVGRGSRQH